MTQPRKILVVDDEADIRNLIKGILEDEGYSVAAASGARECHAFLEKEIPALIVLDIWLQGSDQDGMKILETVKEQHPEMPVIMISGHGNIETAVQAIKKGAYDFVEKPFKSDRLLLMVRRALETAFLRTENRELRKKVAAPQSILGTSHAINALRQMLDKVAPTNSRVLLRGEAGAGKDMVARALHAASTRALAPFLSVNCAALRPENFDVTLFGVGDEPSAQPGLLEQAHGGTLLLDEIADLPAESQGRLVRVLQDQSFARVGGTQKIATDVRFISTTNRDIERQIADGSFRQDLFYRLNVVTLSVPALRERAEDIPALLQHFAQDIAAQTGLPTPELVPQAVMALQAYNWPGNVRQMRNVIEWIMIMNNSDASVEIGDLPPEIGAGGHAAGGNGAALAPTMMTLPLREAREIFERDYLLSQITRFGGNVSRTAQFVGMERSALHRKLKTLQIISNDKDDETLPETIPDAVQKRA